MYRIKLLKTHTHANEVHFAGSMIEVDEATATWLIERGVGKFAVRVDDTAPQAPAATRAEAPPKTRPQRKTKE
jgi:hypothetical protein